LRPATRAGGAAAAAAALLLLASSAGADVTFDGSYGFDGLAVPRTVTPVRVEISSTEKTPVRCTLELSPARGISGVGSGGVATTTEVFLAPGARKRVTLPVVAPSWGEGWTLVVRTDRRTLLRTGTEYAEGRSLSLDLGIPAGVRPVDAGTPVLGILGDQGLRMAWLAERTEQEEATGGFRRGEGSRGVLAARGGGGVAVPALVPVTPRSAPDLWLCYEGLDAVLWVDPDPAALPDAAQVEALLEYAALGGRLAVALGPGARIPESSALARALPAAARGSRDLPSQRVLAALSGGEGAGGAALPVARLARLRGVEGPALDGDPLWVRADHGLGTVLVLAFDPRPLKGADVEGRAALVRLLLGPAAAVRERQEGIPWSGGSLDPLLNHLRKRFVTAPPLGFLVLGLALYVLAIGPFDYLVLKKRNRLRRTVVTFPLIVVGFTLLAYGTSFLLFGGASGQVRVAWLDLATSPGKDADVLRGLDFLGSYSPTGTTLEIAYDQPRSFLGSPWVLGEGGSFMAREGGLDGEVLVGPDGRPAGAFSVPLRSQRTVQARFSGEVPAALDAAVRVRDGVRTLEVANGFRVPLRDVTIVAFSGGRARLSEIGGLRPGERTERDLAGVDRWPVLEPEGRLPDPCRSGRGLFGGSRQWGGGDLDQFTPADAGEEAAADARTAIARAGMAASLASLFPGGSPGPAPGRDLARKGIDLSPALEEGRILVLAWCDGDPLGTLPAWDSVRSTAAVVRRLVTAEEVGR
jgi:hypothetical protein